MPLHNINVDRILSHQEVREMLQEDAWEFDSQIKHLNKRWSGLICSTIWIGQPIPEEFVEVTAWKENDVFNLKPKGRPRTICKQLYFACWLVRMPTKSGLCVEDFENLVCKMEGNNIIETLLDAGFVLRLALDKKHVVL